MRQFFESIRARPAAKAAEELSRQLFRGRRGRGAAWGGVMGCKGEHGRSMGRMFLSPASVVGFASGGRDCSSAEEDDESGRLLRETRDSLWIGSW